MREFSNLLSGFMSDGEGKVAWPKYLHAFLALLHEDDGCHDEQAHLLLAYTLYESPHRWLCNIPADNVHSLEHFCDLIEDTFYHFSLEHLDQKLLQQRKALHESTMDFWQHFRDLQFQASKSQMKFFYLWDIFEYCLKKYTHQKKNFELKPHSVFFSDGATQS